MSEYHIIATDDEFEESDNLFDIMDIIKRLKKSGKNVYVFTGNKISGDKFVERVKRLYR